MKTKGILIIVSCMFLLTCGQKLTDSKAADLLTDTFQLGNEDKPEILGISEDSQNVVLVKTKLADEIVNFKFRKYDKGWRVEEIQNDSGMWVPVDASINLVGQRKRVMTAMKEIKLIATGLMDYITDHGVYEYSNSGAYDENGAFYRMICPEYLTKMPIKDPWGNSYLVYLADKCNGHYGWATADEIDFMIVSYGKDGKKDDWRFMEDIPEAGYFISTDGTEDLINLSGNWIRAPKDHGQ